MHKIFESHEIPGPSLSDDSTHKSISSTTQISRGSPSGLPFERLVLGGVAVVGAGRGVGAVRQQQLRGRYVHGQETAGQGDNRKRRQWDTPL